MADDPITARIRLHGDDDRTVFVFPSDIAASLWLEAALRITGCETLPTRRFVAWDRFKEEAVRATVAGKSPVSSVLRKLYALKLTERNRDSGTPLLSSLVPAAHAADGELFAGWIARLLPQLALWESRNLRAAGRRKESDAEDADLAFLKADYGAFLERNALFEPSWQKPPLRDTGFRYIIFFTEAIEDYTEYAALLRSAPFIETVDCPVPPEGSFPSLKEYGNTREEIRSVALEVEALLRNGMKSGEIALSVPDLETVSPYLLREFRLRSIPVEYRSGEPLGAKPAGRLFSLIRDCVSRSFPFAPLKSLLLDRIIPWKHPDLAEELIGFGIRNHCVTGWTEDGKKLDIWEEAFKAPNRGESGDWRLRDWYRSLRKALDGLASSRSFTECRNRWFAFRSDFLEMEKLPAEDNAVLARCVDELNLLAALESRYRDFLPADPFGFFVSHLSEKNYVPQRAEGGVSIFPYRVAAGTPFARHFILDASQDSATVLYRQLPFLRQDKRLDLFLDDIDASAAFFNVYACTGGSFSCSARSFGGYRTPHGYFGEPGPDPGITAQPPVLQDPLDTERRWLAGAGDFPDRLYPLQKAGLAAWNRTGSPRRFSLLDEAFGSRLPALAALVRKVQMDGDDLRVSQSDLSVYAECPARWFLGKILGIEATVSDAELMNERNLGLLYHTVLRDVYLRIRNTDRTFSSAHLGTYRTWAEECAASAASEHAEFRGPLAAPIIDSLVKRIADGVCGILERDKKLLDGFIPDFLEEDIAFSRDGIRYYGKIDRISVRPSDNALVLIDYKSGDTPTPASYSHSAEEQNEDFQIPAYVFLAEESPESRYRGQRIGFAWFGSIRKADYRPIINDNDDIPHGAKRGMVTRDDFAPAMESFRRMTGQFARAVASGDFTRPENLPRETCQKCDFRMICRYTYAVRPR